MTQRLYYSDSFLCDFDATLLRVEQHDGRSAVVLDRTAFYPTSGGQVFDTGLLNIDGQKFQVSEVAEDENGVIRHFVDQQVPQTLEGTVVHGSVDAARRRDHMQQHSGQHVLSAAFVRLYNVPTVSFHMGDESCTIDLETRALTDQQVRAVEREANCVVFEDLPVAIKSASTEQARAMGVRKIPDHVEGDLRLIDMQGYDLNACGGTHVRSTGQIGPILLRKYEKVKQGYRVEFVCGERAIATARKDFETLTEAAALYATHIWQVPELIRKALDENKAAAKERKRLLEEIAQLQAERMLANAPTVQPESTQVLPLKLVTFVFGDRDTAFIKLLAQKITATEPSIALLGATSGQPGIVFAQTPGLPNDMGILMKEALAVLGGRGGGNRDMAQGGAAAADGITSVIDSIALELRRN